jgi:hypothetical protein
VPAHFGADAQGVLAREATEQSAELGTAASTPESGAEGFAAWLQNYSALDKAVVLHFDIPVAYPHEPPRVRTARQMTVGEHQVLGDVDVLFVFDTRTPVRQRAADQEQAARNAGIVALLDKWLREAEQGIDPRERQAWDETRAALDADRLSTRKLFP